MKKDIILVFLLFVFIKISNAQDWFPDAGIIKPYKPTVTVSSGNSAKYITDDNPKTFWQSNNPLPYMWIKHPGLNIMINNNYFITFPKGNYYQAFDGNSDTKVDVVNGNLEIHFKKTLDIKLLSIKANCNDTIFIDCLNENKIIKKLNYAPSSNYILTGYKNVGKVKMIILKSSSSFSLFELAILDKNPNQQVIFDFGKVQNIGWIGSRHFNQNVDSINVFGSIDGKSWQYLTNLNPNAIAYVEQPLTHTYSIRYVKILFILPIKNYVKAVLWEVKFYDKYGPYGNPPKDIPSQDNWSLTFGVNTIWGWGYSVYSDLIPAGEGTQKFNKVAKQLRSYHRIDWDIDKPSVTVNFDNMHKNGTPAKKWLNWDREYSVWKKNGFTIDVAIMFNNNTFPDILWNHAYYQAFNYGKAFAQHFVSDKKLVNIIEIGNEPWTYSKTTYDSVLCGMANGIRSVSLATILPCAVQSYNKTDDNNNYISRFINKQSAQYISGLNTHIYPYIFNKQGNRVAVNPEDRRSQIWSMNNMQRFKNKNLPGKNIYVTEFGYDSKGGNEDCTHPECVSEFEQAIFGVRMALILWRLGAGKIYWYYFANIDYNSFLHNRSGLASSYKNGFKKKMSFDAFALLQKNIGNYCFEKVILENKFTFAYLLHNRENGAKAIIAWRPTKSNHKIEKRVLIPIKATIKKILPTTGDKAIRYKLTKSGISIALSGIPTIIFLN